MDSPTGSQGDEKHTAHANKDEYQQNQQIFYSWDMPQPTISSKEWPICLREICRYGDEAAGVNMLEDWKETFKQLQEGNRDPFEGTTSHKQSLQYLKKIIDQRDALDHSPLALAARMGCTRVCQFLVENGADVHYTCKWHTLATKHSPSKLTTNPILEAADSGSVKTVECLIK